ncbi:MAG TPA: biopolymer transporter ExbD [Saprospiraceae bacterium]|nr:biopolymer transporter ExbD [Saprospiraceae bacterium]
MGIKKKSKVTPTFNMSSLTDIIFLLLIFFMLTSSLVVPNALNLQLPGKKSNTQSKSDTKPAMVDIKYDGSYYLNNKAISIENLESQLKTYKDRMGKDAVVSVSPAAKASNDAVVAVLDILYRYEIKSSLMDPQ